ncbi:hypothetical protein Cgig2_028510 [Carnegiea gigantea]|uniref:Uncharacterized protein n=1 Tax=Carnegiea gigantea TaxID=171969 RepID=A0A9Q1JH49_9CARY|nr:hypothetical protein Cgig2_028510 [Carnegiea gigantea]
MPNQHAFSSELLFLATDKNYISLLCNGIPVFIAKSSTQMIGPQAPLPSSEISPDIDIIFKEYTQMSLQSTEEKLRLVQYVATEKTIKDEEIEENSQCLTIDSGLMLEEVYDRSFDDDIEEYVNRGYKSEYYVEEEEQEEGEISMMSTEDINRRFEDFLRKMKEELRIEA